MGQIYAAPSEIVAISEAWVDASYFGGQKLDLKELSAIHLPEYDALATGLRTAQRLRLEGEVLSVQDMMGDIVRVQLACVRHSLRDSEVMEPAMSLFDQITHAQQAHESRGDNHSYKALIEAIETAELWLRSRPQLAKGLGFRIAKLSKREQAKLDKRKAAQITPPLFALPPRISNLDRIAKQAKPVPAPKSGAVAAVATAIQAGLWD